MNGAMAGAWKSGWIAPLLLLALSACIPGGQRPAAAAPPAAAPAPTAAAQQPSPAPAIAAPAWLARPVSPTAVEVPTTTYVVRKGDTLTRIVARTHATREDIIRENRLKSPDAIRIGQKLRIPGGRYHVVRRGETGIAIARAYGVAWSRIATFNQLEEPYVLREGQRLALPSSREAASMSIEQRAEAFRVRIDDIVTGGEPALASNEKPVEPVATPQSALPPTTPLATPGPSFDGLFAWPVEGRVIRPFGPLANGARNDGINIAAAQGTPIYAAADGVVAYVGTDVAIYGGLILLRHGGGWITAYGHAERLQVTRGQAIRKGQLIGYVAQAGLANEDQLHFEIRQGRTPVDPRPHLPKRG